MSRQHSRTATRSASRAGNHPPPDTDLLGNPLAPPSTSMLGLFPTADHSGILLSASAGDDTMRNISTEAVDEITRILTNPQNDQPGTSSSPEEGGELAATRPVPTAPTGGLPGPGPIIQRFMSVEGIQRMVQTLAKGLKAHRDHLAVETRRVLDSTQALAVGLQRQITTLSDLQQMAGETKELTRVGQTNSWHAANEATNLAAAFKLSQEERKKRESEETPFLQQIDRILREFAHTAETTSHAQESALAEINKVLSSLNLKLGVVEETVQAMDERQTDAREPIPPASSTPPVWHRLSQIGRESTPAPTRHSTGKPEHSDDETPQHPAHSYSSTKGGNRTTSSGPRIPKEARAKKPDSFNGKRGKDAESFLTRMDAFFLDFDEDAFDDERKIRYVLLNMDNRDAENWAQTLLRKMVDEETVESLKTWANFRELFLHSFADPVKKEKAVKELNLLQQTKDVQSYATAFRILALEVDWNESALVDKFKDGLKPEIKRELIRLTIFGETKDITLEGWVVLAAKADEMASANHKANPNPHKAVKNTGSTDKTTNKGMGGTGGSKPRVIVPEEEKLRRRKEGLCLKCGKANHVMKECRGTWTYDPQKTAQGKAGIIHEEEDEDTQSKN